MEQTASKERAMSSFTKRKGQTTYKVNVFFAENTTATLPYVCLLYTSPSPRD